MKILKIFIYALTVAGIIIFLFFKGEDFHHLTQIHYTRAVLLFLAGFLSIICNALIFRESLVIFNLRLPLREWFGLTVTNTMYNYLLPARGGMAARALFMKKKHALPYSEYISLSAGSYMLLFFTASFLAAVLSFVFLFSGGLENMIFLYLSLFFFISVSGAIVCACCINPEKIPGSSRFIGFIRDASTGLKKFKKNPKEVRDIILLGFLFIFSVGLRLFVAYRILGIHADFMKLVLTGAFITFSIVFSLTPGNIGIKEGIIGVSSGLLGITPEEAVLGALLDRMVSVITVSGLGLVFSRLLLKNMDSNKPENGRH